MEKPVRVVYVVEYDIVTETFSFRDRLETRLSRCASVEVRHGPTWRRRLAEASCCHVSQRRDQPRPAAETASHEEPFDGFQKPRHGDTKGRRCARNKSKREKRPVAASRTGTHVRPVTSVIEKSASSNESVRGLGGTQWPISLVRQTKDERRAHRNRPRRSPRHLPTTGFRRRFHAAVLHRSFLFVFLLALSFPIRES